MKYIIIGRDDSNGNEYVRAEAPATAEEAVELCERLNKQGYNEHTSYRIETINREDNKRFEHLLDRAYPPPRTEDFTIDELFPQGTHAVAYTLTCSECACEVKNYLMVLDKHKHWHNKLLP